MPAQLDRSKDQFRRLLVLIAVATVDMIGGAMVFPLIPFYALKLHASATTIGMIIASFFIAQLVAAPVWGRVSDHYGRRPALLVGLSASAAAYFVFGFANAVWLLFVCRLVQGLGGGTTGVLQAYVGDTVPPEDRARSLGWLSAGTNVGTMLGPVIGSFALIGATSGRAFWRHHCVLRTPCLRGNGFRNRSNRRRMRPAANRYGMESGWCSAIQRAMYSA